LKPAAYDTRQQDAGEVALGADGPYVRVGVPRDLSYLIGEVLDRERHGTWLNVPPKFISQVFDEWPVLLNEFIRFSDVFGIDSHQKGRSPFELVHRPDAVEAAAKLHQCLKRTPKEVRHSVIRILFALHHDLLMEALEFLHFQPKVFVQNGEARNVVQKLGTAAVKNACQFTETSDCFHGTAILGEIPRSAISFAYRASYSSLASNRDRRAPHIWQIRSLTLAPSNLQHALTSVIRQSSTVAARPTWVERNRS
jgi:hypothetical protein